MRLIITILTAVLLTVCSAGSVNYARKFNSAATNNSTAVKSTRTVMYGVYAINTNATAYYLKFYDKPTMPTCGTDPPTLVMLVAPSTGGNNGVSADSLGGGGGVLFENGLGFCLVGGLADNDNTVAAVGIVINLILDLP